MPAATLETTLPLGKLYWRIRTGQVSLATAEGHKAFGLSPIKEGVTRE